MMFDSGVISVVVVGYRVNCYCLTQIFTGANNGAGAVYPSRAAEFTLGFYHLKKTLKISKR
jgi:hypothetical protein